MKAVVCSQYGPPEVLKEVSIQKPTPADDEILIKVAATSVAVADVRIRAFKVPAAAWIPARIALGITKPRKNILGVELSGTIEQIGKKVTKFNPGDKIMAVSLKNFGANDEYLCLRENDPLAKAPKNIPLQEAATLPIGCRTAQYFLEKGNIQNGQEVLIYGASGSVGTYAVQLAKHYGAQVTGVCSETNRKMVSELGADKVLNYKSPDFLESLGTYDMVFLAIDKLPFAVCRSILKENGTFIDITNPLMSFQQLKTSISSSKKIIMAQSVPDNQESLQHICQLVEKGIIRPVIDRKYRFDEIVEAHRYVDMGHKKGNVLVTLEE